jgi:hypothetical protein
LYIYPVVGFSESADIRAIYDLDAGMISTTHLPEFFERHRNPSKPQEPPSWLRNVLQRIPTWDHILTTQGERINGVLLDRALIFQGEKKQIHHVPYRTIHTVALQRSGLFSAYDHLTVTHLDGRSESFKSVKGELHLQRFGNQHQTHQLRNVSQILVGVANTHG